MYFQGWTPDPAEVDRILGMLDTPHISGDHPISGTWDGKSSHWLWRAEEVVVGRLLPSWQQTRGTCVSKGFGRGAQDQFLCDIAQRREAEEWPANGEVATEPIYAGSRVEVGGGRISGDGSVGAWAAKFVRDWGVLLRGVYGQWDLSRPDDALAARWGAPRAGVPDEIERLSREHPVQDTSQVTTADRAADLLASYYSVAVCSNRGFTMRRDSRGFCQPSGSWSHCMLLRAIVVVKGGDRAFAIQNSWGDYLGGTKEVETDTNGVITLPEGCFLARWEVVDSMLRQGDSFAIAGVKGFPARKLDWSLA